MPQPHSNSVETCLVDILNLIYALFSLSSSSDKSVKVWDASSRMCVNTFFDHQDQVNIKIVLFLVT